MSSPMRERKKTQTTVGDETALARAREYKAEHREEVLATAAAWRAAHRTHIAEYNKAHRAERTEWARRDYSTHPVRAALGLCGVTCVDERSV